MDRRTFLTAATVTLPLLTACAPSRTIAAAESGKATPPDAGEHARTIAAIRPPKRARPLIAVVVDEQGSETTDVLIPYGVLSAAGVADVEIVCSTSDEVTLFPALTIRPQRTIADFQVHFPAGADYVIVPASHRTDSPSLVPFISDQSAMGAIIVGVCEGAKTVAEAGLLDNRRGTTHWYALESLNGIARNMTWVPDRRYVVDSGIVTTTGVTASIPVSLAIIEAIGGQQTALATARGVGVSSWTAAHDSSDFKLTLGALGTAVAGRMAFWNKQAMGVLVSDGVDEISLALTADAWSRTYRSRAFTVASADSVTSLRGVKFQVDRQQSADLNILPPLRTELPAQAINDALEDISLAFGPEVRDFVALQLEYPLNSQI